MSTIALIGATGNIGGRVLSEALSRSHTVTAITRDPRKLTPRPGMTVRAASTTDPVVLAQVLKGHDAVIVSVKWNENDVNRVIDTIRKSGVKRALFVVGAGSLIRKDGRTHFDHMMEKGVQPPTSSWGNIIAEGRSFAVQAWWIMLFPGFAISLAALGMNLLGDGLRDVLDPRLKVEG